MGLETYRVRKEFQWDGWIFAPEGACRCSCLENGRSCHGYVGAGCDMCDRTDHCSCRIKPDQYGGDIWLVMEGHPRKETMLAHRFAVPDPSLPPADELIKDEKYKRLLTLWEDYSGHSTKKRRQRTAEPVA